MASKYSQIGGYTSGWWLVADGKGNGEVVYGRSNLPPMGTGFSYYYLGSKADESEARLLDAIPKLKINTPFQQDYVTPITSARQNGTAKLGGDSRSLLQKILGQIDVIPLPIAPIGTAAVAGGEGVTAGAAEGAAASEGAAAGAAAGSSSGLLGRVASSITSTEGFLAWIGWIFHPVMFLRAVEFFTGLLLMIAGFAIAIRNEIPTPSRIVTRKL